ncbi:hypothetical protein [Pseudomonas entomophila]|uniref:hypothetical protein n=1 Tax=Pseudomonas entomophila TaxID=312306 RepID=UPI00201026CE|nr:hypothetical protein [Pseudomonas entomophila]
MHLSLSNSRKKVEFSQMAFYKELPECLEAVDVSERLFRPVLCSFNFAEIPRWRVLFQDDAYEKAQSSFADIVLEFVPYLWVGGEKRPKGSVAQGKGLERSVCWRTLHLIFRVNAHLAGIFKQDEPYDYHRLPADMRVDDDAAIQAVIALAASVEKTLAMKEAAWKKRVKA